MNRTLKKGDSTVDVDLGSSWKLFDNNNINKTISFYCGLIFRTKERVFWMETDDGGVVIDPANDIEKISAETGFKIDFLTDILRDPKTKYTLRI